MTADHSDLMDLASRYAYRDPEKMITGTVLEGGVYEVVHQIHDSSTGLDAYTFENTETHELTIAYVGTAGGTDVLQDAQLVPPMTPAQYRAAEQYYKDVSNDPALGPVTSVCGNSLGGGLAAYVGAQHPDVEAVTVNPAPVPDEYANADAPNVHNYILTTDVLHRAVMLGGLQNRIIGSVTMVAGTPLGFATITENHVGSDREDGPYNASMAVPFSLFHPNTVVRPGAGGVASGGFGGKIQVTAEGLIGIAEALERQLSDLEAVMTDGFDQVTSNLNKEKQERHLRSDAFKSMFANWLHVTVSPVTVLASNCETEINSFVRDLDRFMPPGPMQWVWDQCDGAISGAINSAIGALDDLVGISCRAAAETAWAAQEILFMTGIDDIISELLDQQQQLDANFDIATERWMTVAQQTRTVQAALAEQDAAMAGAVAAGTCPPDAVTVSPPPWPGGVVTPLHSSASKQVKEWITNKREEIAGAVIGGVVAALASAFVTPVRDLLTTVIGALGAIEAALGSAVSLAAGVVDAASYNPLSYVTGTHDDLQRFADQIRDARDDFQETCSEWRGKLGKFVTTLDHLPIVILGLAPEVAKGLLSNDAIDSVYNSYAKCRNLAERSEIAFAEVAYQYQDHTSLAIDAIGDRSAEVQSDLAIVSSSLNELIG